MSPRICDSSDIHPSWELQAPASTDNWKYSVVNSRLYSGNACCVGRGLFCNSAVGGTLCDRILIKGTVVVLSIFVYMYLRMTEASPVFAFSNYIYLLTINTKLKLKTWITTGGCLSNKKLSKPASKPRTHPQQHICINITWCYCTCCLQVQRFAGRLRDCSKVESYSSKQNRPQHCTFL